MNCFKCENLLKGEPIKVVDVKYDNPFMEDVYHFEEGYRCTWNGECSLNVEDLKKGNCIKE